MKAIDKAKMYDFARDLYEGVAPDLLEAVPYGQGHFDASIDFVGDRLYDEFHRDYPNLVGQFGKVAKAALKGYHNDRAETRANERKLDRARVRAAKAAAKPKPKSKPAPAPKVKPRRGIGSY